MKYLTVILIAAAVAFCLIVGCPFLLATGIPCPGCGMTRAFLAAFRFDFSAAFQYHPLFPLVGVTVFALAAWTIRCASQKGRNIFRLQSGDLQMIFSGLFERRLVQVLVAVYAALFVAVYALRMILF